MMFPMIPQYFFGKSVPCVEYTRAEKITDVENAVKVRKKFKIIVSGIIEMDAESENITVDELLDAVDGEAEEICVHAQDNRLKCSSKSWSWLKRVHLAEDCHSCNLILYRESSTPILKLKTVRKILPGEKLVLWFSRELLVILQIPFLLPNNILSEKQYVCHKCRFQCEMPNPIKIHLSLECGKLSKTILWNRLRELSIENGAKLENNCDYKIETIIKNDQSPPRLSPLRLDSKLETPNITNSAFKPYKKITKDEPNQENEVTDDKTKICSILPKIILNNDVVPELNEANLLYKQAVEMETIVSNLGRFKQGHLCIYCGKVYSRKYGLKIHIRTHTGFKPLKCKFCMRPFGDPSNLNKHVRLHSEGDTPYKCDQCGKILVRKRDLDRHMKSRH